jgi:hypothetical protein
MSQPAKEDITMEVEEEEVPELALETNKTKAKGMFQAKEYD